MSIKLNQVQTLQGLYKSLGSIELFTWLDGRNYSDAFVICCGAGPWRYSRRKAIQQLAINKLNGRDLSELDGGPIDWYPLDWQNKFVNYLSFFLSSETSMNDLCNLFKNGTVPDVRSVLYDACGCPNGAKVLSLFVRDSLKLSAFPIDRHVKKFLKKHNLPETENEMIELCHQAGLDPRYVATGIVKHEGNIDNPDWSIK